ncbi:MAG: glycosyltransferase, partial [Planctomycetota bacterium]
PGTMLLACVARLTKQKGLFDLLKAMSRLREAAPEARLLLVGRGELLPKLREAVDLLGLRPFVRFTGFRRDIRRILSGSDLMVLPSHWEGFGLVLLEAMEAGIPVVGTRVGAIPEVVADGETGIIVPPHDPDALATGLVRLLRNPETAVAMGEAGRRRLAEEFGMRKAVEAHENLYEELLRK